MNKRSERLKVTEILDYYCDGCFVKKHYRSYYGKAVAHRFCIEKCTIGQKLRECGKKLT